jgi:hypothetical protein
MPTYRTATQHHPTISIFENGPKAVFVTLAPAAGSAIHCVSARYPSLPREGVAQSNELQTMVKEGFQRARSSVKIDYRFCWG